MLDGIQDRVVLLCPFRPHRRWFAEYTCGYPVSSLAPFAFEGHKQAFPAPLCVVWYRSRSGPIDLVDAKGRPLVTAVWRNI